MERLRNLIIPVDGKLGTINRRGLIKLGGAVAMTMIPSKSVTPIEVALIPSELITPPEPPSELDKYLKKIKLEQELWQKIIEENDLFNKDFKELSRKRALSDFKMYFPMYKAGEEKYGVDFKILWVTHIHESTSSSDINQNDYPFKGCMQRNTMFFKDHEPIAAGDGWEFLSQAPALGKNDWMEILWAASHIEEKRRAILTEKPELLSQPKNLLDELFSKYCRPIFAKQRTMQVLKLGTIKEEFSNPS